MFNFIQNIGPTELIIIALILIVFFGGRAVVKLARTSGETVKEIKKVKNEFVEAIGVEDKSKKN